MDNRIVRVEVVDRTPPPEAELRLTIVPERRTASTEVRGRLMGPRCPYSNTVEIAYPLRPLPSETSQGIAVRVVIPEASSWDPESPFLYAGPVELWQDGARCDRVTITHGFRHVSLGARGLFWNGRPLRLQGWSAEDVTEAEAMQRHRAGCNLVLAPVSAATSPRLWELADRVGLLVLARLAALDTATLGRLSELEAHPSCFGWLVGTDLLAVPEAAPFLTRARVGVILSGSEVDLPAGVRFVAGPSEVARDGVAWPYLRMGKPPAGASEGPGTLGWVE
jgi:hypothetical protein